MLEYQCHARAEHSGYPGIEHIQECFAFREAGMHQYPYAADFVGDFVQYYRNSGCDAGIFTHKPARGDDRPVYEVMQTACHNAHRAYGEYRMRAVRVVLVIMFMAPVHELFEHKEEQDSSEDEERYTERLHRFE